jgi:hypothetical protein
VRRPGLWEILWLAAAILLWLLDEAKEIARQELSPPRSERR